MGNPNGSYIEMRIKNFKEICSNFKNEKISDLIVCHKIKGDLFSKLVMASEKYLKISKDYNFLNMTPNGKLMPKEENEKVFNEIIEIYKDIIITLGIDKYLKKFVVPAIRYKEENTNKLNELRSSRSELPHCDVWAGWGEDAILIQIPILGDTYNNRVDFYGTPIGFNESWIKELKFDEAQNLVESCDKLEPHYKKGYIYVCDISVIHSTFRTKDAKPRMSIDIPIITSENSKYSSKFENEIISSSVFKNIGTKYKLKCVSKMNEINLNPFVIEEKKD